MADGDGKKRVKGTDWDPTSGIPFRYDREIGRMHILKGTDHSNTKQIITWETVKPCTGDRCYAHDMCEYNVRGMKCRVELTYLKAVSAVIYRNFNEVLDEPTMMRIGLHLMPLYQNLCRFLIAELGMELMEVSTKGTTMINPIYKEIREYSKLIESMWKSLGLVDYFIESSEELDGLTHKTSGKQILEATKAIGVELFGKNSETEVEKNRVRRLTKRQYDRKQRRHTIKKEGECQE